MTERHGRLVRCFSAVFPDLAIETISALRIEDLDPPRQMPGATEAILAALAALVSWVEDGWLTISPRFLLMAAHTLTPMCLSMPQPPRGTRRPPGPAAAGSSPPLVPPAAQRPPCCRRAA